MRRRKAPTEEQKQRAAERRERFRALAKRVAETTDMERAARVDRCGAVMTIEGHPLSMVNTMLVLTQRDGASVVGGFGQWLRAGRAVRKGETGIGIWVPIGKPKGDGPTNQLSVGAQNRFEAPNHNQPAAGHGCRWQRRRRPAAVHDRDGVRHLADAGNRSRGRMIGPPPSPGTTTGERGAAGAVPGADGG